MLLMGSWTISELLQGTWLTELRVQFLLDFLSLEEVHPAASVTSTFIYHPGLPAETSGALSSSTLITRAAKTQQRQPVGLKGEDPRSTGIKKEAGKHQRSGVRSRFASVLSSCLPHPSANSSVFLFSPLLFHPQRSVV